MTKGKLYLAQIWPQIKLLTQLRQCCWTSRIFVMWYINFLATSIDADLCVVQFDKRFAKSLYGPLFAAVQVGLVGCSHFGLLCGALFVSIYQGPKMWRLAIEVCCCCCCRSWRRGSGFNKTDEAKYSPRAVVLLTTSLDDRPAPITSNISLVVGLCTD